MPRWLILTTSHLAMLATGLAVGIYTLPIIAAPRSPDAATLQSVAAETLYAGRLVRTLRGSDLLHWGEGEVRISRSRIALIGRLSPWPAYKLYLAPRFVDTKEGFLQVKDRSVRVGDVKTFDGFVIAVPADVDVGNYDTVVIWCEAFDQFISAARYRPRRQTRT
jgi:hypothetical protein